MNVENLMAGALGGAILLGVERLLSYSERKRAKRDALAGLLRLLDVELYSNDQLLFMMAQNPGYIDSQVLGRVDTSVWKSTRVQLAPIVDKQLLKFLVGYYATLEFFLLALSRGSQEERLAILSEIPMLRDTGRRARRAIQTILRDRDYSEAVHAPDGTPIQE